MAKIMDPILPLLSILGYWAIILGSFGGPGRPRQRLWEGPFARNLLMVSRCFKATNQVEKGYIKPVCGLYNVV